MRPPIVASALVAILVHGFLLFGLHLDQPAVPLPPAPAPLVVGLIAAAPAPGPAAPPGGPGPAAAQPATPREPEKPEREHPPNRPRPPKPPAPKTAAREKTNPEPVAREAPPHDGGIATVSGVGAVSGQSGAPGGPPGGVLASAVPRYRSTPQPEYPAEARQQHQEGVVLLEVEVGADGRPSQIDVKQGSGFPILDRAAVAAVRRWTFDPARTAGLPIESRVEIPIRFRLTD